MLALSLLPGFPTVSLSRSCLAKAKSPSGEGSHAPSALFTRARQPLGTCERKALKPNPRIDNQETRLRLLYSGRHSAARQHTLHCTMTSVASESPASSESTVAEQNPLVNLQVFAQFDRIEAHHVVPGMRAVLAEVETGIKELEEKVQPTWSGLVEPLERLGDRLSLAWGVVNHLKAVKDSEEIRKAVDEVQPDVVALSLRMGQSKPLYDAFRAIRDGPLWPSLTQSQQRIVDAELKSAEASGVALEGSEKERFNEVQQELTQLSTKFNENVQDATKRFEKLITDAKDIEGLPPTALSFAAQQARTKGHEGATPESGPWVLTLDFPSYMPAMQHCSNRALREELYRAYNTRASTEGVDNGVLIARILKLRRERAKLLGFECHADMAMVRRMATLESAQKLLEDLRAAAWDASVKELQELREFARERGAVEEAEEMQHWDVNYWAERLREARYELKEEELRPYFSLPAVVDGLFRLTRRLFNVEVERVEEGAPPAWHPDVQFFRVKDLNGTPVAHFYLDPYSRPAEKRGGAWLNPAVGRSRLLAAAGDAVRQPVAYVVCNQTPPVGDEPSLMTFRDVETLFHEFGHALQHMLTTEDSSMVAGIANVEWDAVELPSQFMENWCYHRDTLFGIARHYKTGEPLPEDMYQKLLAARTFRAASMTMRQLHFASIDLELHSTFDPSGPESVFDANARVGSRMLVLPPLPEDRFLCSFLHIFSGGYSAGYYSYKWAEVLSADAFAAFEEAGLEDDEAVRGTGDRFRRTVLALGGGKPAAEVFEEFRGRGPSIEPLLRHNGLSLTPTAA